MPRSRFPRTARAAAVLALGLASAACAHAPTSTPIKEDPMSTAASGTPHVTGEDISRRMLKLIGSLTSNADLNADHVRRHTGLEVQLAANGDGSFGTGAQLDPDWSYNLYVTRPAGEHKSKLIFDFARTGDQSAPMTPVCGLDFEHYARELKSMGFNGDASYAEHGRLDHWNFSRTGLSLQIFVEGESSESPAKIGHHCVKTLTIE